MSILSKEQTDSFWNDGVITVEDAVTPTELTELRATFTEWVEESRLHEGDYGNCLLYTSPSPRDKRQSRMPSSA